MSVKPIIIVPDPVLTQKCSKVDSADLELKQLTLNLIDTLNAAKNPEGAGLAAPQLGVLKRVLIVRNFLEDPYTNKTPKFENITLINPKMISHSKETNIDWEGCLSIPDTYGKVQRYNSVKVRTDTVDGEEFTIKANGFLARIIQHEMDHLDGVLFTTKVIGNTLTEKELDDMIAAQEEKHG